MMEWLQILVENNPTPFLTTLLLGLMTAISPCPLATNITAIGYIAKNIDNPRRAFAGGLLYTLGRVISYSVLGVILISLMKAGIGVFGIQRLIATWMTRLIGPLLLLAGLFMLLGNSLKLKGFSLNGNRVPLGSKDGWGALLLGIIFALAFCPTSAVFYFGLLIPMSAIVSSGWVLPAVFAVATALPVLAVAWILVFSTSSIGRFYNSLANIQKWLNIIVGVIFIGVGLYYCILLF